MRRYTGPLLLALFAGALAVTAWIWWSSRPVPPPPLPPPERVTVPAPPLTMKAVAVIIDDVGHNYAAAMPFIEMRHPVALSVLPDLPFSAELAALAARSGKTVLLHLPMEPEGYPATDPGPGAVLVSYNDWEIRKVLEEDLASVGPISGINNHMGSKATADPRIMETVLGVIADRSLFFVDSRTTPDTVALTMARQKGIPAARRDVFLDNDHDAAAMDAQLEELLSLSESRGWAIGIGHAYPETAQALERMAVRARERGIQWISLESVIAYAGSGD